MKPIEAACQTAVILVNWNGWTDTIECLDTLIGSELSNAHVFVVDNLSTDDSVPHIFRWLSNPQCQSEWSNFPGVQHHTTKFAGVPIPVNHIDAEGRYISQMLGALVTIIESGANRGFAGGNNVALRHALRLGFDWFWLLNTDTVVRHDTLAALMVRATQDPTTGIVGSTLIFYSQPKHVQSLGGGALNIQNTSVAHIGAHTLIADIPKDSSHIEEQMAYVIGASMFVSRPFVEAVGLMQEDYFLYFEEIDWAMRGKPKFNLGYAPTSWVYHKVGGSSSKVVSEFSLNLLYKNRLRFVSRFLPHRFAATKRALAFELCRHVLKGRWLPAKLVARTLWNCKTLADSASVEEKL